MVYGRVQRTSPHDISLTCNACTLQLVRSSSERCRVLVLGMIHRRTGVSALAGLRAFPRLSTGAEKVAARRRQRAGGRRQLRDADERTGRQSPATLAQVRQSRFNV